jgi:hypothetical protein
VGQIIQLPVVATGYPETAAALDPPERALLIAVRWWVADFRQSEDPLPRLCRVMDVAGAHDAAFSVDQLMAVFVSSARQPMTIHCPHSPDLSEDEKHLLNVASLVQAGESKWRNVRCGLPCSPVKARSSLLALCVDWASCSPRPS